MVVEQTKVQWSSSGSICMLQYYMNLKCLGLICILTVSMPRPGRATGLCAVLSGAQNILVASTVIQCRVLFSFFLVCLLVYNELNCEHGTTFHFVQGCSSSFVRCGFNRASLRVVYLSTYWCPEATQTPSRVRFEFTRARCFWWIKPGARISVWTQCQKKGELSLTSMMPQTFCELNKKETTTYSTTNVSCLDTWCLKCDSLFLDGEQRLHEVMRTAV